MTCAHPNCKCTVQSNSKFGSYCSEHCQKNADHAEAHCTCGHPGCK